MNLDIYICVGFPGGSDGKESACSSGDPSSFPGLERSLGEGNGYPHPVFWPGNFHRQRSLADHSPRSCTESDTTESLSLSSSCVCMGVCVCVYIYIVMSNNVLNINMAYNIHKYTSISSISQFSHSVVSNSLWPSILYKKSEYIK